VEKRLQEALKADRARIQVGRISRFGLLEMSRQRLRLSLGETAQEICPRCEGRGTVRNIQSHGLSIIRLIEEEALKDKTAEVQVQLPPDMATFLTNEKREFILNIEKRHGVNVVLISNPHMQSPQYNITRLKEDNVGRHRKPSYSLIQQPEVEIIRADEPKNKPMEPVVKPYAGLHSSKQKDSSMLQRVWNYLFTQTKEEETNKPETTERKPSGQRRHHSSNRNANQRRSQGGQQNRRRRPSGQNQGGQRQGSQNQGGQNRNTNSNRRRTGNTNQQQNPAARQNNKPVAAKTDAVKSAPVKSSTVKTEPVKTSQTKSDPQKRKPQSNKETSE